MTTAAILLAAGRASRFGSGKLAAPLDGRALICYAAETLAQLGHEPRIAVVGPEVPDLTAFGFISVRPELPDAPLSSSLACGVERSLALGATRVLIALADMPFVPLAHFAALLAHPSRTGVATQCGEQPMPPAVFGPNLIPALLALEGDRGARDLLRGLPAIALAAEQAIDIDNVADLARAELYLARLNSGSG